MSIRQVALGRLALVGVAVVVVVGATWAGHYWLALTVGIGVGVLLFLLGMATGGSLGNARKFEKKPADINARIGTCLAASGIASAAIGYNPPFPLSFRVFYGVCLGIACVGALILSAKALPK
jgi:hypothetical protein